MVAWGCLGQVECEVLLATPLRGTAKKPQYSKVPMGESWACRCKPGLYGIAKGGLLAAEVSNIAVLLGPTGLKLECGQAGAFSSAEAAVPLAHSCPLSSSCPWLSP